MQIRRGNAATHAGRPDTQERRAAGTPGPTAMPARSARLSIFPTSRGDAGSPDSEASSAGRPRIRTLAKLGLFAAGAGVGVAMMTGCSSGVAGQATGASSPPAAPSSSGQSTDPTPTDSPTVSSTVQDPSTSAASPTSVPSLPQPSTLSVPAAQFALDQACEKEALLVAAQLPPSNPDLARAQQTFVQKYETLIGQGRALKPALDAYMIEEESATGPDGKVVPEPPEIRSARDAQMNADIELLRAEVQQDPTNGELQDELKQERLSLQRADSTIPAASPDQSGSVQLPSWLSPG